MESRSAKVRTLSIVSCVLLLLVLLLGNLVFARASARIDLTEEKLYTLNEGSRAVLEGLEDPATVKVFWHNVPSSSSRTRHYLEGLLQEMQDTAGAGLQVQWIDMEDDTGIQEAQRMGVSEYIFGEARGDEIRQSKGYMSLSVELGDEKPLIINELHMQRDQIEYKIVSELHRRSRIATPVVGLVAGDAKMYTGSAPPRYQALSTILSATFGPAFRPGVSLENPVPPDVEVLIVVAPRDWEEVKAYHLEQFVLRGGKVFLLLDPVGIDVLFARGATGQPARSGLESWLEHLGITVDTGAASDFRSHGLFLIEGVRQYPAWPIITSAEGDQTNPVARAMPPMLMRWPVGFTIDDKKQSEAGRTVSVLASTSDAGYRRPDLLGLKDSIDSPDGKLLEKIPLMLLVEGSIESFWNGKPLPKPQAATPPGALPGLPPDDGGEDTDSTDGGDGSGSPDGEATGSPDGEATGSPDGAPQPPKDPPKSEEPKPEEPKSEEPKPEEPKSDEPKSDDPPKSDEPEDPEPATDGAPGPASDDGEDAPADGEDEADDGADPAPDPADDAPDGDAGAPAPAPKKEDRSSHLATGTGRMIVLGDAGIVSDYWLPSQRASRAVMILAQLNGQNGEAGFNVVRNATDWLTGSEELLRLRSRNDNPRTLDRLERDDQKFVQWLNVLLIPFLVLIAGLVVFVIRRR